MDARVACDIGRGSDLRSAVLLNNGDRRVGSLLCCYRGARRAGTWQA